MIKYITRSNIHLLSVLIILVGLPLSPFLMSVGQVLLVANWVIDINILHKLKKAFTNKITISFLLIIGIHLVGLIYTENFDYAWRDLRVKWPLLFLPLVFSTTKPFRTIEWRSLIKLFGIAVFIGTIVSTVVFFMRGFDTMLSAREISVIISHIRFSLMICLTIFLFVYMTVFPSQHDHNFKWWAIPMAIWLSVFLMILGALTGLVVLGIGMVGLAIFFSFFIHSFFLRFFVRMVLLAVVLIGISFLVHSFARYQYKEKIDVSSLPSHTENGTPYRHYMSRNVYENGHFVYAYIASSELKKQWNKRSNLQYNGFDNVGNDLKYTLIRYLASKNLRRDSSGVVKLTDVDISAIENGLSNYIFLNKLSLYPYLYRIFWEFDRYQEGANPSGSSIIQRLYYVKAGWNIFLQNPVIGVGTGDVNDAFLQYYDSSNSVLTKERRLRSHNQFVSILVGFGAVGFALFLWALFFPIVCKIRKHQMNVPFMIFFGIALLSMLNEDTLETQAGALFFVFFYAMFYWGITEIRILKKNI